MGPRKAGSPTAKTLESWRQQDLSPDACAKLNDLIELQRLDPDDLAGRDALLDEFMAHLTEDQLVVFVRLLRELTEQVH